jgi:hypothetical protein
VAGQGECIEQGLQVVVDVEDWPQASDVESSFHRPAASHTDEEESAVNAVVVVHR